MLKGYATAVLGFVMRSDWSYLARHGDAPARTPEGPEPTAERSPEAVLSYYTGGSEHGEPAGRWWGPGAAELRLAGDVDPEVMERLYGGFQHPETGEALGTKPRRYATYEERLERLLAREPLPTPERRAELELAAHKSQREARHYADLTFSPAKSWSVLHTALEHAGRDDEAEAVWAAWTAGVQAGLDYLMRETGYSRAGYHGAKVAGRTSGRWVDAHDWVVSLWRHHTSRDGDPQLHVHAAVLNRVLCDDGVWRSLDSHAIAAARPAAGAICERVAEEELAQRLGVAFRMRPDGKAREIVGIGEPVRDLFSSRRRAITAEVAERVAEYQAKYGHAPSAYTLRLIAEHATLKTRLRKPEHEPPRAERLADWEQAIQQRLGMSLNGVLESVRLEPQAQREAQGFEPRRVIQQAIADVEQGKAVWNRHDLTAALIRRLPDELGGLEPAQLEAVVGELADRAVGGDLEVVGLTPPAAVEVPDELRRSDGRSRFEPHRPERYATARQLSREENLLSLAGQGGAPRLEAEQIDHLLAGTALGHDQAAALRSLLGSGKRLEVLVGPAGTGKSYTLGRLTALWREAFGTQAFGVAAAQNAVRVLADEGFERGANISQFLAAHDRLSAGTASPEDRQRFTLPRGGLLVIDEGSMVSTVDLSRLAQIAAASDTKVLLTGDPQQLAAVDAGSGMRLLAERAGALELSEVRRFAEGWEREASLGLRAGDAQALLEYDRRGRFVGGSADEMRDAAYDGFLADLLAGQRSLLLVGDNETAADLSTAVREALVELGRVEPQAVPLRNDTLAGVGDLIQTRRNRYGLLDEASGRPYDVVNRQVWRVVERRPDGGLLAARQLGRDDQGQQRWDRPRLLPGDYVAEHVELAYASTVHAAQGRTVDRSHLLVEADPLARANLYVGLSRGIERNVGYVVTEPGEHRLDRLTAVLERPDGEQTALEVQAEEFDAVSHLGRLGPVWSELVAERSAVRDRQVLEEVLGSERADEVAVDQASGALHRSLRSAELDGHDAGEVLRRAVMVRELDSAESVAQVLHYRVERQLAELGVERDSDGFRPSRYAARTPRGDGEPDHYLRQLAAAMDDRAAYLAEQASTAPPLWADRLGPVPDEPLARTEWLERAAAVASYREHFGYSADTEPIGPAPGRGAAERRAAWLQAAEALGLSPGERELADKSTGELYNLDDAYRREEAWLPPNVDDRLRTAHLAQREAEARAVRLEAEQAAAERVAQAGALAARLGGRTVQLEEVAAARTAAVTSVEPVETAARAARAELRRRGELEPVADEPSRGGPAAPDAIEHEHVLGDRGYDDVDPDRDLVEREADVVDRELDDQARLDRDLERARAAVERLRGQAAPDRADGTVQRRQRQHTEPEQRPPSREHEHDLDGR